MKKNRIIAVLCLALVLLTAVMPAMAEKTQTKWVKTPNGGSVALREKPTTKSKQVGKLEYRTKVIVYESKDGWYLVEPTDWSRSNPAWVKGSYLVSKDPGPYKKPTPTPKPTSSAPTYKDIDNALKAMEVLAEPYAAVIKANRSTNYVHLRWIPCTSGRYIAQYLPGEAITVLAESKTWAQVQIDESGYVGFILKNNVDPIVLEDLEIAAPAA